MQIIFNYVYGIFIFYTLCKGSSLFEHTNAEAKKQLEGLSNTRDKDTELLALNYSILSLSHTIKINKQYYSNVLDVENKTKADADEFDAKAERSKYLNVVRNVKNTPELVFGCINKKIKFTECSEFTIKEYEYQTEYIERRNNILSKIKKSLFENELQITATPSESYLVYRRLRRNHLYYKNFYTYPVEIVNIMIKSGMGFGLVLNILKQIFMTILQFDEKKSIIQSVILCTFGNAEYQNISSNMLLSAYNKGSRTNDDTSFDPKMSKNNYDRVDNGKIKNLIQNIVFNSIYEIEKFHCFYADQFKNVSKKLGTEFRETSNDWLNPVFYEMVEEFTEKILYYYIVGGFKYCYESQPRFYKCELCDLRVEKDSLLFLRAYNKNTSINSDENKVKHKTYRKNIQEKTKDQNEKGFRECIKNKKSLTEKSKITDESMENAKNANEINTEIVCSIDKEKGDFIRRSSNHNEELNILQSHMFNSMVESTTEIIFARTKFFWSIKRKSIRKIIESYMQENRNLKYCITSFLRIYLRIEKEKKLDETEIYKLVRIFFRYIINRCAEGVGMLIYD